MKQNGIIKCIIEAVGLDDGMSKGRSMPSEANPLVKDDNVEPVSGMFSNIRVVRILLYLSRYTRPYVALDFNSCTWYMFSTKRSQKLALKRLARYLKKTKDRGLVLKPNSNACKVYAYPDADFYGMYRHEKPTDTVCVKIRTGFITTFSDFPVLWVSKLQTNTALSTMESEIIATDNCRKELFPMIEIVTSIGKEVGRPMGDTMMNVSVHEENTGDLVLSRTFPPHITTRSR